MSEQPKSLKPQELQALQADLKRRVKELDAREEYLDEREQLLQSAPIDLKVLEETIAVRQRQLEQLKSENAATAQSLRKQVENTASQIAAKQRELDAAHIALNNLESEILTTQRRYKDLQVKLREIQTEITDRRKYLADQETVITETIDEGNAQLRGIHYEIQAAQEEKDAAKQEIANIEQKRTDRAYELVELEDRFNQEQFNLNEQLESLKAKIKTERQTLTDLQVEASRIQESTADKMRTLDIREKELLTKQGALVRERSELEDDRRRWNSTKSLYDIK